MLVFSRCLIHFRPYLKSMLSIFESFFTHRVTQIMICDHAFNTTKLHLHEANLWLNVTKAMMMLRVRWTDQKWWHDSAYMRKQDFYCFLLRISYIASNCSNATLSVALFTPFTPVKAAATARIALPCDIIAWAYKSNTYNKECSAYLQLVLIVAAI